MAVILDLLAIRRHVDRQISPNGSRAYDRSLAQERRPQVSTLTCAGRTWRRIGGALVQCRPVKGCQHRHQLSLYLDLFRADKRFGRSRRHLAIPLAMLVVIRLSGVGHDVLVALLIVIRVYSGWCGWFRGRSCLGRVAIRNLM